LLLGEEGPRGGRAWFEGHPPAAGRLLPTAGGLRSGRLNEIIITYLGNLSIANYKWFRCYGIEDGKVETRNVKVETGRAERVKPRTLFKTNPQRVRHPGASQRVKGCPPAILAPGCILCTEHEPEESSSAYVRAIVRRALSNSRRATARGRDAHIVCFFRACHPLDRNKNNVDGRGFPGVLAFGGNHRRPLARYSSRSNLS